MKNLTNKQLVLIKKCIGAGCALICLLLMFFKVFNYTSSSSVLNGDAITWSKGVSLYSFLFNGDLVVLDSPVSYLREMFGYSHVIMWISFVISLLSLGVLVFGIFSKKNLFSKIGSIALVVAMALFITISFDSQPIGDITVKYLSIFTPFYIISLIISVIGLFSTLTLKDK